MGSPAFVGPRGRASTWLAQQNHGEAKTGGRRARAPVGLLFATPSPLRVMSTRTGGAAGTGEVPLKPDSGHGSSSVYHAAGARKSGGRGPTANLAVQRCDDTCHVGTLD
jgi:hypothetical protein